ncbi:RF10.5 [Retroperitoneal fibromatosis-associated herpesvirus]|uniref:RF10.5 n=1 Tax=Retroperitoneal fibromatosis-associated herpesvirus TaxID=111469 RepID=U5NM33_9GAMA|nr:RF10.5 [Retroperitoneal fibromatosis-associated herpesvirus]AGY30742.1 RF10.5 [Retroperitoneal fibromatosis-associated herpesvirus]
MAGRRSLNWVTRFIVDALDSGKYDRVFWLNKEEGTFVAPCTGQPQLPESCLQFFNDFRELCISQDLSAYVDDNAVISFSRVCTTVRRIRRARTNKTIFIDGVFCRAWQLLGTLVRNCWWCRYTRAHAHSAASLLEILFQHEHSGRRKRRRGKRRSSAEAAGAGGEAGGEAVVEVGATRGDDKSSDSSGDEGPSSGRQHPVCDEQQLQLEIYDPDEGTSTGTGGQIVGIAAYSGAAAGGTDTGAPAGAAVSCPPECDTSESQSGDVTQEPCVAISTLDTAYIMQEVGRDVWWLMHSSGDDPFDFLESVPLADTETSAPVADAETSAPVADTTPPSEMQEGYVPQATERTSPGASDSSPDDETEPPTSRSRKGRSSEGQRSQKRASDPRGSPFIDPTKPMRTELVPRRRQRHRVLRATYYRVEKTPRMIFQPVVLQAYYYGELVVSTVISRDCVVVCSQGGPEVDVSHACLHTRGGLRFMLPVPSENCRGSLMHLLAVLRGFAAGIVVVPTTTAIYIKNLCGSPLHYYGNYPWYKNKLVRGFIPKAVIQMWDMDVYLEGDDIRDVKVYVGDKPEDPAQFDLVPLTIRLCLTSVDPCDTGMPGP